MRWLGIVVWMLASSFVGTAHAGDGKCFERREAKVHAVAYRGPVGPNASGVAFPIVVRISQNQDRVPSVGVMEQFAGGAGAQWRTAAWIAAFTSTQALGRNLMDFEFIIKAGGQIDGPSAGMLFTASMLALIDGVPLLPTATMTGTVNPDGSAGPVGGIPQKMQGAKRAGMRSFGFPIGGQNARDLQTGRDVDLFGYGKRLGLKVREIRDIHDAYEHMTGKTLKRFAPAPASAMALSSAYSAQMAKLIVKWTTKIKRLSDTMGKRVARIPPQLRGTIEPLGKTAVEAFSAAKAAMDKNAYVAAYYHVLQAAVNFEVMLQSADFLAALNRGDAAFMARQYASKQGLQKGIGALANKLEARARVGSVGGLIDAVSGFQTFIQANAYFEDAQAGRTAALQMLQAMQQGKITVTANTLGDILLTLLTPAMNYAATEALLQFAADRLSMKVKEGKKALHKSQALDKHAIAYASAAAGGLAYFEALTVTSLAEQANRSLADARQLMRQKENSYKIVSQAVRLAQHGEQLFGNSVGAKAIRLAAGASAYLGAASLVNKYYSLQQMKPDGTFVMSNPKALAFQLQNGKQQALVAAARAKATVGFVPHSARATFQLANNLAGGDAEEKLDALENYWASSFWSNLARSLASP